ncbi:MAG: response regulator [Salinarimonadaceae bacterium]|nr:MAG: response regulator [Salinarimonadaceae bacterium]
MIERGSEHILVVEDDDLVRAYVVQQLDSLGYQVSEAPDGPTALAVIRERSDIDLLFTDIVLPGGMSGYDLAEAAGRLRPELRVLYTSGYSEESIARYDRPDPGGELLKKPYRRQELARRLRSIFEP